MEPNFIIKITTIRIIVSFYNVFYIEIYNGINNVMVSKIFIINIRYLKDGVSKA